MTDLPPDYPIEPNHRSSPAERIAASQAALGNPFGTARTSGHPDADAKANFIAAARRAAQAASSQLTERADRRVPELRRVHGDDEVPSNVLGNHARLLLVAASVVMVVLGSLQLFGFFNSPNSPSGPVAVVPDEPTSAPPALPRQSSLRLRQPLCRAGNPGCSQLRTFFPRPALASFRHPSRSGPRRRAQTWPHHVIARSQARYACQAHRRHPRHLPARTKRDGPTSCRPRSARRPARRRRQGRPGRRIRGRGSRFAEGRGVPQNLDGRGGMVRARRQAGPRAGPVPPWRPLREGHGRQEGPRHGAPPLSRGRRAGNAKAMHNLAVLYAEGVDGKPDYQIAAHGSARPPTTA